MPSLCRATLSLAICFSSLIVLVAVIELYGPTPQLPCGILLLGSVTATSAVVLRYSCHGGERPAIELNGTSYALDYLYDNAQDGTSLDSIEFQSLRPSTYYHATCADANITFRTFPGPEIDSSASLSLTFGSCSTVTIYPWSSLASAYDKMLSLNPQFSLFLGDNTYVDISERIPWYRIPYDTAHMRILTQPSVINLMNKIPTFVMFDDHEVQNDFSGGLQHVLAAEGIASYLKYWGQRNPGRSTNPEKLYYNFTYGKLAAVFVLETRLSQGHEEGRILGESQKMALFSWINHVATERFTHVIVASPRSWSMDGDGSHFRKDRDEIFSLITKLDMWNIIILSGDMHYGASYSYAFGRVLEFSASPIQALNFWPDIHPRDDPVIGYKRLFIYGGTSFFFGALNITSLGGRFDLYRWPSLSPQSEPVVIDSFSFSVPHVKINP